MNEDSSKFAPLIKSLEDGNLSPSQLSTVSQALHVGMLSSALGAIKENDKLLGSLSDLEDKAVAFVQERLDEELPVMALDDLLNIIERISKLRNESVKAKLKIHSTRDLFNLNPISEDDRALLSLLRMVDSSDKRQKLTAFLASLTDNTIVIDGSRGVDTQFSDVE